MAHDPLAYSRARRAAKRERGECTRCPNPAVDGGRRCALHAREAREEQVPRSAVLREEKRRRGECHNCPEPAMPDRTRCAECAEDDRRYALSSYYRHRAEQGARDRVG